jgi:FkbH-like protein
VIVEDKRERLKEVKAAQAAGDHAAAWAALLRVAEPDDPFELQDRYAKLAAKIPARELGRSRLKLALLGTSTLDHFAATLRFWLAASGFELELFMSDYGTLEQTVLDPKSELYRFKPEIVWLFTTGRDVLGDAEADTPEAADAAVRAAVARTRSIWSAIAERLPAQVVQNNADLDSVRPFGNFEGAVTWSRTNLLRAYNVELARAARAGVTIFDLDYLAGDLGRRAFHDSRWWYHSKHAIAPESLGIVAHAAAKLIASIKGRAKKCVVLDLDNTLWGGVIGDDGLEGIRLGEGDGTGEAHSAFQRYLKRLERRGIVLAVASKNEDAAARLPFERHPEMVLKLEDIAVFRANWNDKASNIRGIATALNLGLDSFVFVDDNPVERDLVRRELPMVAVPELGDDPAGFRELVDRALFFETTTFSADDRGRASAYRQNAQRADAEGSFTDVAGFLRSLAMRGTVGELDEVNLPRFVQLLNKSNQFHLTTTRYTEAQVRAFMSDPERACVWFRLEDRFGDNGLISTVILELPRSESGAVTIDTWAMSCRVLSRGMEEFIASEILGYAKRFNGRVVGRYIPTAKNGLVRDLYSRLGFQKVDDRDGTTTWEIDPKAGKVDWSNYIERVPAKGNGGSR